ncbi:hypothetical protein HY78_18675 [Rhizorhabdus wittichii DC-6]|nr:hypothetical protein HY78_18675 [Rhizorhabdus wittichii DC-6]
MSGSYMPLSADRWTGLVMCIRVIGVDLSAVGADAKMQIRSAANLPDGGGEPLRTFGLVADADVETVPGLNVAGVHVDAGVPTSVINLRTFDISDLPWPDERGDDVTLEHDLHVKAAGGVFQRAGYGPFTVRAGVARPGVLITEGGDAILAEDGSNIITE